MTYYGDPSPPARSRIPRIAAPYRGYIQLVWAAVVGVCLVAIGSVWLDYVPDADYDQRSTGYDVEWTVHPGSRRRPNTGYYIVEYRFRDAGGVEHTGASHSSRMVRGDTIPIEYRGSDPSISRSVGARRPRDADLYLVWLFLCIGGPMVAAMITIMKGDARETTRPTLWLLILPIAAWVLCPTTVVIIVGYT